MIVFALSPSTIGSAPWRILVTQVHAAEPAAEVERHPGHALADALGDQRLHLRLGAVFGAGDPDPAAVLDAALTGVGRTDLYEHVLLQLGEPFVGPGFLATAFVFDQATGRDDQRKMLGYTLVDGRFLYGKADIRQPELLRVGQRRILARRDRSRAV